MTHAPDIILVGCVKKKLSGKHPAQDLYISTLFLKQKQYVKQKGVRRWFILSGKYGLLEPTEDIEWYDCYLGDLPCEERREWSRKVLTRLNTLIVSLENQSIEIHAGTTYWDSGLKDGLEQAGATVVLPLKGLPCHQHPKWYDTHKEGA